jgi:hypothetical protein
MNRSMRPRLSKWTTAATAVIAGLCLSAFTLQTATPQAGPRPFDTPQQAADALVQAAETGDIAALVAILGPGSKDIVSSGDPVEDKNDLARFVAKAKEKMKISFDIDNPNQAVIVAGKDDWPMPIPLVKRSGKWRFDLKEGRAEILARRIGGNELEAIMLLRGYVEAQREYASRPRDGNKIAQYAQKWISTPGRQDGLSWRDADGQPAGPIGDEIAKLLAAGYTDKAAPINGYYFRTLTAQGPAARLGARDYIVQGKMIGGFAAIAWPANYGVTGVQTFQVNSDGIVYQKDLGPETAKLAPAIKRYNPDKTWIATDDAP